MKDKPLLHNENNYYLCLPLYNAGNAKLLAGRRVIISPQKTLSETPETKIPSTINLCNVQTSEFIYKRPNFGFQGNSTSLRMKDDNKEIVERSQDIFKIPIFVNEFKVIPAEKLMGKFPYFAVLPGAIAITSANTILDMKAGHSFNHAAIAEIIGSAVSMGTTQIVHKAIMFLFQRIGVGAVAGIAGVGLSTGAFIGAILFGYWLSTTIVNSILNDQDKWIWNRQ